MDDIRELRRLRLAFGFRSARAVATRLGIDPDLVSALERGALRTPGPLLERYARALRADPTYVAVLYWRTRARACRALCSEADSALEQALAGRPKDQRG
jgi:transcriptional regulator with XRE-family HTH domain